MTNPQSLEGHRILILTGKYAGKEGVCLGLIASSARWSVSPNCSNEVLELCYESEFALLLDLSTTPSRN
jgi:hypothetical protein